jgi:hypothetical protein
MGMLEVIESDMQRTITETERIEREQAAAFLEFKTTTNVRGEILLMLNRFIDAMNTPNELCN